VPHGRVIVSIMQNILVPLDGTEYAWRALEYAASLAGLSGGCLSIVTVVGEGGGSPSVSAPLRSQEEQEEEVDDETTVMQVGNDVLDAAETVMESHPGLECNYILMHSEDVAGAILEAIRSNHCDTVVLGCRGRSLFHQLLRRSVCQSLVEKAEVPVFLIK
jgi:nucleotide-binding universal stress UspA family protein